MTYRQRRFVLAFFLSFWGAFWSSQTVSAALTETQCAAFLGKCNTISDNCSSDQEAVGVCGGTVTDSACCKPKPKPIGNPGSLLNEGQCASINGVCNGTSDSACPNGFQFEGVCSGFISNTACCKPTQATIDAAKGTQSLKQAGRACCLCGAGLGDAQCVQSPNDSCLEMEKSAKNPVLKTYICRPLSAEECATISTGSKGLCPNVPIEATSFTGKKIDGPPVATAPELNIPIPGLQLKPTITAEKGNYNIPWLGQYIAAVYNYVVSASIIAAAVMMTYGGFLYIMGSNGVGSINSAKSIISDALIGLFLVIALFTIIKTFASGSVTNSNISIQNISPVGIALEQANLGIQPAPGEDTSFIQKTGLTLADVTDGATAKSSDKPEPPAAPIPASQTANTPNPNPSDPTTNPNCNPKDKILRYAQGQAPWGGKPFGKAPLCVGEDNKTYSTVGSAPCCQAYAYSACGPTALAMVLKAYGADVTPETIGKLGIDNGLRNCNVGGMSPEAVIGLGRYPDFEVDYSIDDTRQVKKTPKKGKDLELLNQTLKAGKPVILLCGNCTVKRIENGKVKDSHKFGGHFMLLTGVYDDGNYALNDPSMGNFNFISQTELKNNSVLIYIRRKDNAPVTVCKS